MTEQNLNPDALAAAEDFMKFKAGTFGLHWKNAKPIIETYLSALPALPANEPNTAALSKAVEAVLNETYGNHGELADIAVRAYLGALPAQPDTVNSVEELDQLPINSVVLDRFQYPHHKYASSMPDFKNLVTGGHIHRSEFYLPATVIYRPVK